MKDFELFHTPSMIWGPLRLFLFLGMVYIINLLSIKKGSSRPAMDYFILRYCFFNAALVLTTLFLTQIDSYDLFVILWILFLLALERFLNINPRKPLRKQLRKIKRRSILYVIKSVEHGERWISSKNLQKKRNTNPAFSQVKKNQKARRVKRYPLFIGIGLGLLAIVSRYYFFLFDSYLLSDLWYADLGHLKSLSQQHWFFNSGTMMGEAAVIKFYSDITGINDAVALTSFGLIESYLLTFSIFWSVNKLLGRTIVSGLIAALSFMFLYVFIPLNINLMTQAKSTLLAMSIALPYMVYVVFPNELPTKSKRYFIGLLLIASTIFFIDLFVMLFFLPTVVLVAGLYNWNTYRKKVYHSMASFFLALISGFLILFIASLVKEQSLIDYLSSNLYYLGTYTYAPQLIYPLEELITVYQVAASLLLIMANFLFYLKNTHKSVAILSTVLWVFFMLPSLELSFIDSDVLNQMLSIFIPILMASLVYVFYILTALTLKKDLLRVQQKLVLSILGFALLFWLTTGKALTDYPKKNLVNVDVLKAYDRMKSDLLPYSYLVVNDDKNFRLGENSHYFIDYEAFNTEYLQRDLEYQAALEDPDYLKSHPELVLPQSTFIFKYRLEAIDDPHNELNEEEQSGISNSLKVLIERGRPVKIYFKSPRLTVYEVINKPKASRINDLLL